MTNTPPAPRGRNFLMTPGPTPVPERVLGAMVRPAVDLNADTLVEQTESVRADLARVLRTSGKVYLFAANGHGAWEASVVNVLERGARVLVPEQGHFSRNWAEMAESFGVDCEWIEGDWRRGIDPQRIEARLRADSAHRIKAVLAVQVETAAGISADVAATRAALDAAGHPALLMADVVASLGTMDFQMDAWGVDVAIGASQKALMCPPGVSFTAVNDRAREIAHTGGNARDYLDWRRRDDENFYDWFRGTSPEHLVYAMREALDMVNEEGLPAAFVRHTRLAGAVHAAVERWAEAGAVMCNAELPEERAPSVTAVRLADGYDANAVRGVCNQRYNVSLGGGLGRLDGHVFRIGHMGFTNEPTILGALGCVELALAECGVPHASGGVEAAMAALRGG